jgi:hypothetical protein
MSEALPPGAGGEPRTVVVPGDGNPTLAFQLPPGVTLDVESVLVEVDATGAGGPVTATLVVADQSGVVIARKRQAQTITAGALGSATWALRLADDGGGSGVAGGFEYVRSFAPVTALATGAIVGVPWGHFSGAALLSYTNPLRPTIIADGVYAFNIQVYRAAAVFGSPGSMFATLALDPGGAVIRAVGLALLNTLVIGGGGVGLTTPVVDLVITRELSAGMELVLQVSQGSGGAVTFEQVGVVQRLG